MRDFGLYIHIPFCQSKCPYCSFYSITDDILQKEYLDACIKEISFHKDKSFDTIYIGGGTPSLINPVFLDSFLGDIMRLVKSDIMEFTIEVNPESVTCDFVSVLKNYPVNRISIGAQSFDDNVLRLLGRVHSADKILKAYELLACGYNMSIDLIYDISGVDYSVIEDSLRRAVNLRPSHISAYSYSPDTGYLSCKDSDDPFQMERVIRELELNGYPQYEVSNYGSVAIHNSKYWKMDEYIGVGASSHSMVYEDDKRLRYSHVNDIKSYIDNPLRIDALEYLEGEALLKESLVFGLRMLDGININRFEERFSKLPPDMENKINLLKTEGFICADEGVVKVTNKGLFMLDSIMEYIWR